MTRENKLAKNTVILSVGTVLPKLAAFVTLPVLTGRLTQNEYGIYDLVIVLESLLMPTATLQIQTAAFRYLIDARDDSVETERIITNTMGFIITAAGIVLTVFYLILPGVSSREKIWICIYFLSDILVSAAGQIARGLGKYLMYSVASVINAAGKLVFILIFVDGFQKGLEGSMAALAVSGMFAFLYLAAGIKLHRYLAFRALDIRSIRQLLKYSWPMVPNSMSMWIVRASDRFIISAFMGVSANAVYAVANKIPSLLNLFQNAFTMAWQENASSSLKDEDVSEYYSMIIRKMFDFMAGCFGLLVAACPILFAWLIKGNYDSAFRQMPLLFMGIFFYGMSACLGGIYVAYKATRSVGITTFAAAAFNILMNLALIRSIGLSAASLSTLFSYMLLFLFRLADVKKLVRIQFDYRHFISVTGVMILECTLCLSQSIIWNSVNFLMAGVMFFMLNRDILKNCRIKAEKCMNKYFR